MRLKIIDMERGTEKAVDFGDKVLVGRSSEVDLQILHRAVSRRHAELVLDTQDDAEVLRFKVLSERSACVVRGCPRQEGVLKAGDPLSIGPIAVVLEKPGGVPRKRLILYGIAAVWTVFLVALIQWPGDEKPGPAPQPLELSPPTVTVSCSTATTCETQATQAYTAATNYANSPQDPANYYKAVFEFTRAEQFARSAGRAIQQLADLPDKRKKAWDRLSEEFEKAQRGYKRATEDKDWQSANVHADQLLSLVPADHPLRQRLEKMKRIAEAKSPGGRN